jgi:hypothetical protein
VLIILPAFYFSVILYRTEIIIPVFFVKSRKISVVYLFNGAETGFFEAKSPVSGFIFITQISFDLCEKHGPRRSSFAVTALLPS